MARKKQKIVVDLDLPKDDPTARNFYLILAISILLGTASGLLGHELGLRRPRNGEPMFTNLACSTMTGNPEFNGPMTPSYAANQSCSILQDEAQVIVWGATAGNRSTGCGLRHARRQREMLPAGVVVMAP